MTVMLVVPMTLIDVRNVCNALLTMLVTLIGASDARVAGDAG